ncbi:MAG: biotin transporter BioY [Desulfobacterales bacterium]|nr:biotin transporter BioY [Desulfobacterales bacterium]
MVYASLFAALTAVGAYLFVPIGPVPIVLQNMFVFLAGLLLGSRWGLASVAVYLLAGICGLPVFAGGTGGIGRFVGPTGRVSAGLPAGGFSDRVDRANGSPGACSGMWRPWRSAPWLSTPAGCRGSRS